MKVQIEAVAGTLLASLCVIGIIFFFGFTSPKVNAQSYSTPTIHTVETYNLKGVSHGSEFQVVEFSDSRGNKCTAIRDLRGVALWCAERK